jgi:tetratricopeptide (TPR) repeat protein
LDKRTLNLLLKLALPALLLVFAGSAWNVGSRRFWQEITLEPALRRGIAAYAEGRLDQALARFSQAVTIAPADPIARYLLAQSLEAVGREDEAISHYREVLRLNPQLPEVHYSLAVIHNRRREHSAAIAEVRQALLINPDFTGARLLLGGLYLEQGDYTAASSELNKLVLSNLPRDMAIDAHNLLGRTYLELQNTIQARYHFSETLRLDHTNREAGLALEQLR